ncbi:MAG: TIR domain-containing protein [Alistipes sp.]|nr:TIR domain-containing protein [Alistipes sp.]
MNNYDIFISYRREDGNAFARQMQLKLENFGYKVFLDVEELKDGIFDQRIIDAIVSARVFIALLTPQYLCRCASKEDWVRKEIECALDNGIHLVPINIDRLFKDFPEDCPIHIRGGIGQHQFSEVFTGQQFSTTMRDLDDNRLRPYIRDGKFQSDSKIVSNGAVVRIRPDMDCVMLRFGELVADLQGTIYNKVVLRKGRHIFDFISKDCAEDRIEKSYEIVYDEDYFDVELMPIKLARLKREEAERKVREEAARKAREEAERKAQEEAELKAILARKEAERKEKERIERIAREEAERKKALEREEVERKAKEEAERVARKEAERKLRDEMRRKAREEAERKAKEEAERIAKEKAERKAQRQAKLLSIKKSLTPDIRKEEINSIAKWSLMCVPIIMIGAFVAWYINKDSEKLVENIVVGESYVAEIDVENQDSVNMVAQSLEIVENEDMQHEDLQKEVLEKSAKTSANNKSNQIIQVENAVGEQKDVVAKIYKIGDFYSVNGKEGVVIEISDAGLHGKIISLDQTELQWCTEDQNNLKIIVGASNLSDGKYNTDMVMSRADCSKYPAFVWCRSKGKDWYLPSMNELRKLLFNSSVFEKVNTTLKKHGHTQLHNNGYGDWFWSSTESEDDYELCARFVGLGDEGVYSYGKQYTNSVRAMAKF